MQKNQITFFLGKEIYSQFRKTALEDQVKKQKFRNNFYRRKWTPM